MNKSELPIVASAKRTGSTILQNIVHIICTGDKGLIQKFHGVHKANPNIKVIVPIRDPRDTAISFYRTILVNQKTINNITNISVFKDPTNFNNIHNMVQLYNFYKNRPNSLIIRYEDVYSHELGNYDKIVNILCKFLEIENTQELNDKINHILSIDKIKKVTDELATFKSNDSNLESSFCVHGNHIESKSVLSWRDRVNDSIVDELNQLYKLVILELGYKI